jgi:hypothetical protein
MASPRHSPCVDIEDGDISHPSSHLLEKDLSSAIWFRSWNSVEIQWWRPIAIYAAIICVYTLVIFGLALSFLSNHTHRCSGHSEEHLVYCESVWQSTLKMALTSCKAPAFEAVIRHKKIEDNNGYSYTLSPYSGNPSPENDKAWGDLLKGGSKLSHSLWIVLLLPVAH